MVASHADCGRVQDPYTLRCAPQVLGAVMDALDYVAGAIERELDAVTDNPLVFPAEATCCRAATSTASRSRSRSTTSRSRCASWRSFSERRTYALLSPGYAGLPPFLTPGRGCRRA